MTISLEHVTKKYGDRLAVDDASFEVPAGQITGFVGANGAGKTTVMRIMMGLLSASSGKVMVDGQPISHRYQAGIGYMPDQQALQPDASPEEQLLFFAKLTGIRQTTAKGIVSGLLEQLGLADRAREPITNLSLGNRRRVQLASVLLKQPTALVMDEPFSGLDPQTVDYMEPVLRQYAAAGVAILFSSHQLDLVERLCDRLVVIGQGRIKADGSVKELTEGQPGRLVFEYADAALPDGLLLPEHATVVSHDPDARKLIVDIGRAQQAAVIRQLANQLEVLGASRQKRSLAESYRGIVEGKGSNNGAN